MKRKGFTLVEIIISISIILIIGVFITFFIVKNSNDDKLIKQILETANTYIKVEKDSNGNVYANEIIKGAQGVQIPLSNLVNKGYIDEELANEVYKSNPSLENNQDYYILFVQEIGGESESYCNENEITSYVSWMPKGDNIYLCNNYGNINKNYNYNFYQTLIDQYYSINDELFYNSELVFPDYISEHFFVKTRVNEALIGSKMDDGSYTYEDIVMTSIDIKEEGLFSQVCFGENCDPTFFYRGSIENNYVWFHGEEYRILNFNSKVLKLVQTSGISNDESLDINTILDSWYSSNFSNLGNIMTEGEFCTDSNNYELGNFNEECSVSNDYIENCYYVGNICSASEVRKVGLITLEDAFYAGIFPYVGERTRIDSFQNYDLWLAELKADTCIKLYDSEMILSNKLDFNTGSLLTGTELFLYDVNISINPVIVLDINYIKFSGTGTKNNPYIIEPIE